MFIWQHTYIIPMLMQYIICIGNATKYFTCVHSLNKNCDIHADSERMLYLYCWQD